MKVTIYLCDLCGVNLSTEDNISARKNDIFHFKLYLNKCNLPAELCKICYSQTVQFIIGLQKSTEEKN